MTRTQFGCGVLLLLLAGIIYLVIQHPLTMAVVAGAIVLFIGWRVAAFIAGLKRAVREMASAAEAQQEGWGSRPRLSRQGRRFWRSPGSGSPDPLGELLYVGQGLASVGGGMPEPALIDPALELDGRIRECHTSRLDHWPSYATCSPQARAGYLTWLTTGRSDPGADIGYVFLYFYGLERRALHDMGLEQGAEAERPAIIAELDRLLSIYGGNASFQRHASSLRDLLAALELPSSAYLQPPSTVPGEPLTFADQVALGMCAADGAPLPAAWAYRWILHQADITSGVVAQRAPAELEALFGEIYRSRHGEGLVLPVGRARLRLSYAAASPSFLQEARIATSLPDVRRQGKVVEQLAAIAAEARDRLAPYSRRLGRNPSAAGTAEALLALPVSLWPEAQRKPLTDLAQAVRDAGGPLELPFSQLQAALPPLGTVTRTTHKALCERLAGLALGMEPDPRFGGPVPAAESPVVLFADEPDGGAAEATARYLGFAAMLQLAAAVAGADGELAEAERAVMQARIRTAGELTESERRRLTALLRLPPRTAGLTRRLAALDARGREAVGDFLVEVAGADHPITPVEIRSLQKSFAVLGLDADAVFARVHAAAAAAEPAAGVPPQVPAARGVSLDAVKVARLQADSEAVATLLAGVFTESPQDEGSLEAATPSAAVQETGLPGLDGPAARFLQVLLRKPRWSRAELAALAREGGLPLDGVLERLNEAALDALDAPLFEDGDPLVLNPDAAAAVAAAGAAGQAP